MTNEEQKLREIAYKHAEPKVIWNDGNVSIYPDEEKIESLLSDLTALISEHYVAKEEVDKMVSERLKEYHLNEGYDVVIVGNPDKEIPGDILEDIKVAALELGELRGLKVMITGFTANYLKTRDSHE